MLLIYRVRGFDSFGWHKCINHSKKQNKMDNPVVQTTQQEQEIKLLQIKREADFDLTPIGQQVKQFEATMRIARMYAVSSFIPDSYKFKNKQPLDAQSVIANCTIALEMATRMQANPLMVMQNLYIVHGQPSFSSKFLIACINASKRFSPLRYEFKGEEGTDEYGCRAIAYEAADTKHKEPLCGDWITMKMVKAEGWTTKTGSKWLTMPSQMLRYRAAAFWQRVYCPEISMGLMTTEEINDQYAQVVEVREEPKQVVEVPTDEIGRPSLTAVAEQAQKAQQIENQEQKEQKSFGIEEWKMLKKEHNEVILLVNYGAYYEAYEQDAETVAQVLDNIETHTSDKGFTKAVSIPKSYLQTVLPTIIRSGNRIAIHDFKTNNDVRQQQSE
jgi:hypothetical protein